MNHNPQRFNRGHHVPALTTHTKKPLKILDLSKNSIIGIFILQIPHCGGVFLNGRSLISTKIGALPEDLIASTHIKARRNPSTVTQERKAIHASKQCLRGLISSSSTTFQHLSFIFQLLTSILQRVRASQEPN